MDRDEILLTHLRSLQSGIDGLDGRLTNLDNKWDSRLDAVELNWDEKYEAHAKDIGALKAFKNKVLGIASALSAGITYLISYFREN